MDLSKLSEQELALLEKTSGKPAASLTDQELGFVEALHMKYGEKPQSLPSMAGEAALHTASKVLSAPSKGGAAIGGMLGKAVDYASGPPRGGQERPPLDPMQDEVREVLPKSSAGGAEGFGREAGAVAGDIATILAIEALTGGAGSGVVGTRLGLKNLARAGAETARGATESAALGAAHEYEDTGEVTKEGLLANSLAGGASSALGQGMRLASGSILKSGSNLKDTTMDRLMGKGGRKFAKDVADAERSGIGKLTGDISEELTTAGEVRRKEAGDIFKRALETAKGADRATADKEIFGAVNKLGYDITDVRLDPKTGRVSVSVSRLPGSAEVGIVPKETGKQLKESLERYYEDIAKEMPAGQAATATPEALSNLRKSSYQATGGEIQNPLGKAVENLEAPRVRAARAGQAEVEEAVNLSKSYGAKPQATEMVDKSALGTTSASKTAAGAMSDPIRREAVIKELESISKTLKSKGSEQKLKELASALELLPLFGKTKEGSMSQVMTTLLRRGVLLPSATPATGAKALMPALATSLSSKTGKATRKDVK